jgi:molybdopterin molybdotransferase
MTGSITEKKSPMLSVEDALSTLLRYAQPVATTEKVQTIQALGRVLAEQVVSGVTVPPLDNSAMDGYAVRVADLNAVGETTLPVSQRIPAGQVGSPLQPGTAARIFTGAPIPEGADTVIMQEDCTVDGDNVTIRRLAKAGENIRRAGEDVMAGAEILAPGTRIGPGEMGLAASVGAALVPVFRKLRVATFYTGDEIVMPGQALKPGQIYNSNRFALTGLLERMGCEIMDLGIVPDKFEATVQVLDRAAEHADLVITSGGVSVGEEDHVKAAVEKLGRLEMWRIAMKPGKPLAFGMVRGAPFIGLPGNPVSAFVTFCLFVRPFILQRQGVSSTPSGSFSVRADFSWPKAGTRREYVRGKLQYGLDGMPEVSIYPNQSSGVLTSVVWADGLVDIPIGTTVEPGQIVRFIPFSAITS